MVPDNDITSYVLKNYERPFRGEGGFTGGEWDVLSDWTRNQSLSMQVLEDFNIRQLQEEEIRKE